MPKKPQNPQVAEKLISIIEDLVKQQAVANNTRYAKRDFKQLFIDADKIKEDDEELFKELFSEFKKQVEQNNIIGSYKVSFSGSRKARVYEFTNLPAVEIADVEKEVQVGQKATDKKKYGHPEDTYHIFAHVALMFLRKCVCISLEKTTGKKIGVSEHPDMIGVISGGTKRPEHPEKYPDWAKRSPDKKSGTQLVGIEVKHRIENQSDLYRAVIEARHNSRYFDESWLVANINEKQVQQARRLGSEYNVGILNIDEDDITRSQIEWNASRSKSTMCPEDFLLREGQEDNKRDERLSLLDKCHTKASGIDDNTIAQLYEQIVNDLLTDQVNDSIVGRLPETVRLSLKDKEENEDQVTLIGVIGDFIFSVYPQRIGDGEGLVDYLREINFEKYGEGNKELLSKETYERVKEGVIKRAEDVIKELSGLKSRKKSPKKMK